MRDDNANDIEWIVVDDTSGNERQLSDAELHAGESNDDDAESNRSSAADWRAIDHALRAVAKRRGALDSEEATLLCDANRAKLWRELGKVSFLEYLEDVLGYGPRSAQERVRVALALEELPEMAAALASGELPFSAIREFTRIATPMTEPEWREHARAKNLRQIEHATAGRKKGDRPGDPVDPDLRKRRLQFVVRPATFALLRQAQQVLETERGMRLDDDALIAALATAVLDGAGHADDSGRAKHQILSIVCDACGQGWQEGAGLKVAIDDSAVARAECDAQRLAADGRATQDVPPKTQRLVRRRDGGKCCVPGCRSARNLEIHHIVPRAAGGTHTAENLTVLCDGHHAALHDGKLTITGDAPMLQIRWTHHAHVGADSRNAEQRPSPSSSTKPTEPTEPADPTEPAEATARRAPNDLHRSGSEDLRVTVPASKLAHAILMTEAKQALVTMGYKKLEASAAVQAALFQLGTAATTETVVVAALKLCLRSG